ncbi:Thermonuclease precursor [compost metagenome]
MSPEEPYGQEASAFTRKLLQDKKVTLEFDKSERDRYGRLLAYAYIGEEMVNELLLEKGLARVAVFPPDVRYEERFRDVERKAQAAGLGIWSVE